MENPVIEKKSMTMIQALRSAMDVMLGKDDNVVVCLSGRGDKDLATYMRVMESA